MVSVISFSKGKQEKFCRCEKCKTESRHRALRNDEIDFHETLEKAINRNT
jgi:hypothetical protein